MNRMNEIHDELNEFPILQRLKHNSIKNSEKLDASFIQLLKEIPKISKPKWFIQAWVYSAAAVLIIGLSVFYLSNKNIDETEISLIESELIFDEITLIQEFVYAE
jgi:hypothetical protein